MINIEDKKILENKFAQDFASPFYPMLAEIYLLEGDLRRARMVCEIGIDHDYGNIDGRFIYSKVAFAEENFLLAEKLLKNLIADHPSHFNAIRMLIKLELQLRRSPNTIQNYIKQILDFFPDDPECHALIKKMNPDAALDDYEKSSLTNASENTTSPTIASSIPENETSYNVEKSMATFTMVQILISQRYYHQALSVLDMLQSAGRNPDKISKKRSEIMALISESQK